MEWPTKIQQLNIPASARIVAVSDIHGNLPFFTALMDKVGLTPDDHLVILGDILEKGQESLALLRHIMSLQKTHQVHTVCGNCDGLVLRFLEDKRWDGGFFENYLPQHPESTLRQMAAEIDFADYCNLPALRTALRTHFQVEWDFLKNLPHILETEHFVFVHGGVPSLEGMDELDAWQCMKNDYFWDQGRSFPKPLVVGHCPVTLFHRHIQSAAPLIDRERNIYSIDGGCVLKLDGQLNALILQNGDAHWLAVDGQPIVVARHGQLPSTNPLNVRWGHNEVEIVQDGKEFSLCKHLESGRTLPILTKYLRQEEGKTLCQDCTDYCLAVEPGDRLSLCEVVEGGILAKKNGQTGWYWGEYCSESDL